VNAYVKLLCLDRGRSVAFYKALGFEAVATDGVHVHLRWPAGGDLFLVAIPSGQKLEGRRGVGVMLCFAADAVGLDVTAERARAVVPTAGLLAGIDGPKETPWHTRELVVADPDGYRMAFVTMA
jgi:catechol 2,3-dioxygenase-like lactoylglutathione lyase family enzyme